MNASPAGNLSVLSVVLSVLLLATLSGCTFYDARHPTTGSNYANVAAQDQKLAEERERRALKKKEWDDVERNRQKGSLPKYFE